MKILITGGSGFIGKAITRIFSHAGHDLNVLDIKKKEFLKRKNIKYFSGSVLNNKDLLKTIDKCHTVIHLAAALGVQKTDNQPLNCLHVNIQGTINVLKACVKKKVKKIIFISSSEVYGDQKGKKIKETDPVIPKSVYAVSKLAGEEYIKSYAKKFGIKYNICRFFNVYGFDQKPDFVIPIFFKDSLKKKTISVYGNGNQVRSFCNVYDAAKGMLKILENGKNKQIYNIGNDKEPISIKNLAKKVKKITNNNTRIKFVNYKNSDREKTRDIFYRSPNIDKARKEILYEPSVSLDEGLKMMLDRLDAKKY